MYPIVSFSALLSWWLTISALNFIKSIALDDVTRSSDSFFEGFVEEDKIIFTSVPIPRYTNKAIITIFIVKTFSETSSSTSKDYLPFVLFKYNGLPTVENYDEMFQLPDHPYLLQITDFEPDESELFIGIWGGMLLHSYRYFAGSPTAFLVGERETICGFNICLWPSAGYTLTCLSVHRQKKSCE